jgi:hypothetical protein
MTGFRRSRATAQLVAVSGVSGGRPLLRLNAFPDLTGLGLPTLASSFRRRRELIKRSLFGPASHRDSERSS